MDLYSIFIQIDLPVNHFHPIFFQKLSLYLLTAKSECSGEFSFGVDDTETGNVFRIRVLVKGISHSSCHLRFTCHGCNLTIGCHMTFRNLLNRFIDSFGRTVCD